MNFSFTRVTNGIKLDRVQLNHMELSVLKILKNLDPQKSFYLHEIMKTSPKLLKTTWI